MSESTLREGMEVYDSEGKKLGKTRHFFSAAPDASTSSEASAGEAPAGTNDAPQSRDTAEMQRERRISAITGGSGEAVDLPIGTAGIQERPPDPGGLAAGGVILGVSDTKYFEVHHGGLLGLGGESLYIPFSAVNRVDGDDSITLNCTAEEAASLYGRKPAPLDAGTPESAGP